MLYYLFEFLETQYNLPGASLFDYLSFRAAVSVIISLIISVVFGKRIIEYLRKRQIGENVRKLGLEGEEEKSGTPTMGGVIILFGLLISVYPDLNSTIVGELIQKLSLMNSFLHYQSKLLPHHCQLELAKHLILVKTLKIHGHEK